MRFRAPKSPKNGRLKAPQRCQKGAQETFGASKKHPHHYKQKTTKPQDYKTTSPSHMQCTKLLLGVFFIAILLYSTYISIKNMVLTFFKFTFSRLLLFCTYLPIENCMFLILFKRQKTSNITTNKKYKPQDYKTTSPSNMQCTKLLLGVFKIIALLIYFTLISIEENYGSYIFKIFTFSTLLLFSTFISIEDVWFLRFQ